MHAVDAIWTLDSADKSKTFALNAETVIDYYDPYWKLLWVRVDGDVSSYIPLGAKPLPIRSGQRVRFVGKEVPNDGLSGDMVTVTILSENEKISPMVLDDKSRSWDELNAKRVSFNAFVNSVVDGDSHHLRLQLAAGNQTIVVTILLADTDPIPNFEQSFINIEGTIIAEKGPAGKTAQIVMWVNGLKNVRVTDTLQTDGRFKSVPVPIESLRGLGSKQSVHIRGAVQSRIPGRSLTIRDESGQIELETAQLISLKEGDPVEAVGFPVIRGTSWVLEETVYRLAEQKDPGDNARADLNGRLPRLRLADQVVSLTPEEAARRYPVGITGVVTWASPDAPFFFLSDSSGSVLVNCEKSGAAVPEVQDLIKLRGTSLAGNYAPSVSIIQFEKLGAAALPEAMVISLEQALTGVQENSWVALEGYVRNIRHQGTWAELDVLTSGGEFTGVTSWDPAVSKLIGNVVKLTGVCTATADAQRQLTGIRLWVPSLSQVTIQEEAPLDPFTLPERTIASLRRFSTAKQINRRVHVMGTVIHTVGGRNISIQDGPSALRVFLTNPVKLELGDRVEVAGFPGRDDASVILREATVRKIATGTEPAAIALDLSHPVQPDLDGRLVTVSGRVLESFAHESNLRLSLESKGLVFECLLEGVRPHSSFEALKPGAELSVKGVYEVQLNQDHKPERFLIRLRTPGDIKVLHGASWWSAEHALIAVAAISVALLLGLLWVVVLRRRVRAQMKQLRNQWETEAQLKTRQTEIVENASDFIYTVDNDGRFTSFNAAGERLSGYSRTEAVEMHLSDLLVANPDEKAPEGSDSDARQGRLVTKDNRYLWVETSARPIFQGDERVGELGIVRDIGKRKQIEEELTRAKDVAEAAARSKSAFLANMSHEIRTPMNGVIGMSNLLLDTKLTAEQQDFTETIRNSADALLIVLNDILDFSKIEAGKLRFETLDFDLRDVVEGTLELLAPRASSKGLELTALMPAAVPNHLRGDPGRLRQVMLNLVGNAIKFTGKGEIEVNVEVVHEHDESVELRFAVRDTGIGLSAEAQGRLFRAFSQADESTTRRFGGTGLGLVISKQIVEMMHGSIGVESEAGKGSKFWFTAKLGRQSKSNTLPPHEQAVLLQGKRALIVDDNETNRRIVRLYVAACGMLTEEASDGRTALAALRQRREVAEKIDVVLCDYQMPEMDGMSVCREIHRDPSLAGIPRLLLTSLDRRVSGTQLGACGITELLTKPLRRRELIAAILRSISPVAERRAEGNESRDMQAVNPAGEFLSVTDTEKPGRILRVLVAEDNVVNQRVTMFQLKKLGHKVEVAGDGLEVLEALERTEYDVILMDCQMPEMDGYETTKRIRLNNRHRDIRIIAMTANAMKGDREICLAAGMDDYVSKPTAPNDLSKALSGVHVRAHSGAVA